MNRAQLDDRNRAAIGRWWVTLRDTGGRPPQQLLDELTGVAEEHALDAVMAAIRIADALRDEVTELRHADGAATASKPPAATTAPRRRQPARSRSTK